VDILCILFYNPRQDQEESRMMSFSLTDDEEIKLHHQIGDLAVTQMTDEEVASCLNYTPEEFQEILGSYPDLARKLSLGRQKGLAMLRSSLWEKVITQKSFEAMKYLAAEYLNMGVVQQGGNVFEQRVNVSPEKLKKIHDLLTE
jgi:hypothetical protein